MTNRNYRDRSIHLPSRRFRQFQLFRLSAVRSMRITDFDIWRARTIGANLRYEMAGHQFKVATGAVSAIATAFVMVVGAFAVRDGRLSVGSLLVLMSVFYRLVFTARNFGLFNGRL